MTKLMTMHWGAGLPCSCTHSSSIRYRTTTLLRICRYMCKRVGASQNLDSEKTIELLSTAKEFYTIGLECSREWAL